MEQYSSLISWDSYEKNVNPLTHPYCGSLKKVKLFWWYPILKHILENMDLEEGQLYRKHFMDWFSKNIMASKDFC